MIKKLNKTNNRSVAMLTVAYLVTCVVVLTLFSMIDAMAGFKLKDFYNTGILNYTTYNILSTTEHILGFIMCISPFCVMEHLCSLYNTFTIKKVERIDEGVRMSVSCLGTTDLEVTGSMSEMKIRRFGKFVKISGVFSINGQQADTTALRLFSEVPKEDLKKIIR